MSKVQAIAAFKIIFMMLWLIAAEIRGSKIDNTKFNVLWNAAQEIIKEGE